MHLCVPPGGTGSFTPSPIQPLRIGSSISRTGELISCQKRELRPENAGGTRFPPRETNYVCVLGFPPRGKGGELPLPS